ncbi:hypothetical protein RISK_002670 [Rhodopirellula islandica]|uniref:Uncharacterized protein n=1 Tax=Rhodopirellula islandica TaxID=595434 RepID=A0A0J1BFF4_RHOIS|nr:hypothetical protein RISK_002670 [Rhodopirellula islandica]
MVSFGAWLATENNVPCRSSLRSVWPVSLPGTFEKEMVAGV